MIFFFLTICLAPCLDHVYLYAYTGFTFYFDEPTKTTPHDSDVYYNDVFRIHVFICIRMVVNESVY